jgi:hypothetical protein
MNQGFRAAGMFTSVVVLVACASPPPPPPPPPAPSKPVVVVDESLPATLADVASKFGSDCPLNELKLQQAEERSIDGVRYQIDGLHMRRLDGNVTLPLQVAVMGAIKDAEFKTRENLTRAKEQLRKAGGGIVIINGDVAENDALTASMKMVSEVFDRELVLVHAGNSEWVSGFNDAYLDAAKNHPNLINMNWVRDLDLGGLHIISLPGWSVRQFVRTGGCHYDADDVAVVEKLARAARSQGCSVMITAHGPPRGQNRKSLDATFDFGNVGDEALAALLQQQVDGAPLVAFGLFSHILEAGARATKDAATHAPLKLPLKKPLSSLYVNVGSVSSGGMQLLDNKTIHGMMGLFTVESAGSEPAASVRFVTLRK